MQRGARKVVRAGAAYGYAHPDCRMGPPPGVAAGQALSFDLELLGWVPAAKASRRPAAGRAPAAGGAPRRQRAPLAPRPAPAARLLPKPHPLPVAAARSAPRARTRSF
jgi:hypothetical protein